MVSVSSEVYAPAEDSFLLERQILECNLQGKVCLDLGTGSGVQAIAMIKAGADYIVCADINPLAIKKSKINVEKYLVESKKTGVRVKFIKTNLFEKLNGIKFDFVAFNPPYVPSDGVKWVDLDGGVKGRETIDKFITQIPGHIANKGEILLLLSSLNFPKEVIEKLKKNGFIAKKVSSQKLFFEELLVVSIERRIPLAKK